jgi:hypothetical protein
MRKEEKVNRRCRASIVLCSAAEFQIRPDPKLLHQDGREFRQYNAIADGLIDRFRITRGP